MLLSNGIGVWIAGFGWRLVSASTSMVIAVVGRTEWVAIYACTSKLSAVSTQVACVLPDSGLVRPTSQLHGEGSPAGAASARVADHRSRPAARSCWLWLAAGELLRLRRMVNPGVLACTAWVVAPKRTAAAIAPGCASSSPTASRLEPLSASAMPRSLVCCGRWFRSPSTCRAATGRRWPGRCCCSSR